MQYHVMPVTIFKQNCSLVWCKQTNEAALIDPGGETLKLRQEISGFKVTIKQILLTHGHLDHVGAACELSKFYGVPVIGPHFDDKSLLENLPGQCQMFGVKDISPLKPNSWLTDNETVNVGKIPFNVLHCPGHSPGHIVFYNKELNFIFMGDVLFKGSIGRTDLPGSDIKALIRSINHKLLPLGDNVCFLPGHGAMSTLGHEYRTNPFL